jgi:type III pantothenate kinase
VDAGTATKFDVVEEDFENKGKLRYVGGIIAAGVGISFEALINNTSKLRMVSLIDKAGREIPIVGPNTEWALRSGAVHGFITMVDGLVAKILGSRGLPTTTPVIATGGFSPLLRGHSERCTHFNVNHTLEGYYAIAKKI